MKLGLNCLAICLFLLTSACMNAQEHNEHHGGHHAGHLTPPVTKPVEDNIFKEEINSLPEAQETMIIEVEDGGTIVLNAHPVKQQIDGEWIYRLAYNGSLPGPVIKVKQGTEIQIVLENDLPLPTTLHPHGVRVDDLNDGVPHVGQLPIQPGDSFSYRLRFPDAGVFWYHPHIREDYTQAAGLLGLFIVEPSDPDYYNEVHREKFLILEDVEIGEGKLPYHQDFVSHTLMGRFGNQTLINGRADFSLDVNKNETIRFAILNAAATRVYSLKIPGIKMKIVGSDNGLFEREEWRDELLISPSERYIVEVKFTKTGDLPILNNIPSNPVKIGSFNVSENSAMDLSTPFEKLRESNPFSKELAQLRNFKNLPLFDNLRMTLDMDHSSLPMPSHGGHGMSPKGIEWEDDMPDLNAKSNDRNVLWKFVSAKTGKVNHDISWRFSKDQYYRIRFYNDPHSMHPMQHPVHFHGQRFVVLTVNGKVNTNLAWKDSVLIQAGETLDILLETSNPGHWMMHCHISEHHGANMLVMFSVE